ncbi:hypothetical protein [Glycomyces xiaoerkulensis]|uniref:hypothetical protein n=1 Tax=Glycomyces xiaoerkulensis TaxID=2038139 RepID=UPI000C265ADB|nr:hypothetical protein [Glycomyces xiaoerkulensis]
MGTDTNPRAPALQPRAYAPIRREGRNWDAAVVAGRPLRFWADLAAGRVVVCTDELEPRDVGLALDIDADDRRGWMLVNPQQAHWAAEAREALLRAAIGHYNRAQADPEGRSAAATRPVA